MICSWVSMSSMKLFKQWSVDPNDKIIMTVMSFLASLSERNLMLRNPL